MLMPPAHNYLNNASCGYLGLGKKKEPYYIFVSFTWSLLKPTLCLCSILCIIEAIKSTKTELLQLSWIRNGLKTVFWIVAGGDLCAAPAGILHHSSLHNLILNNSMRCIQLRQIFSCQIICQKTFCKSWKLGNRYWSKHSIFQLNISVT